MRHLNILEWPRSDLLSLGDLQLIKKQATPGPYEYIFKYIHQLFRQKGNAVVGATERATILFFNFWQGFNDF